MKTTKKLIKWAMYSAVLATFGLVGCEEMDSYSIDAPSDLQSKIDSIAAAKASIDTGDTTYIDIVAAIVGAEDYSSGWNTAFSDYFIIPTNQLLVLEFINHNGGSENNWNNWILAVTSVKERAVDADTEGGYFTLRGDAWGWGGQMADVDEKYTFDINMVSQDYPDTDGDGDVWNDFRNYMDGAYVTIEIDHSATGNLFLTATAQATDGTVLTQAYQQPVSAIDDIFAFLIADASYFDIRKAYLIPSKVTEIIDVIPSAISITGTPSKLEIGSEDFWGNGLATVTFADGSSTEVDTADLSFNVPDLTTLGEKTVTVSYSKSKEGEYGPAVSTFYTLEVTNSITELELTTAPILSTYAFYGTEPILFDANGLVVTATYSDGSTNILDNSVLNFEIPLTAGAQEAIISYVGTTSTVTTTCPLMIIEGTSQVGAIDFSTGFWGAHSSDFTVASNTSETISFFTYSDEVENFHCPITVLRNSDYSTEYAVMRWDNAGWGDYGFGTAIASNDWDWDTFSSNISGSKTVLTVTNNGDNTADLHYDVTYPNGETHFQLYEGITVDSSDLTFAVTVENCYHVIVE